MSLFLEIVRELPIWILLMWGGWVVAGALLGVWHVRARTAEQFEREQAAVINKVRSTKSAVRPPSSVKMVKPAESAVVPPLPTIAPPASSPTPATGAAADVFSELEALLQPAAETGGASRRPGD